MSVSRSSSSLSGAEESDQQTPRLTSPRDKKKKKKNHTQRRSSQEEEEEDEEEEENRALAGRAGNGSVESQDVAVQIHTDRTTRPSPINTNGETHHHYRHHSLIGLSDHEVELSPTLRRSAGRSEENFVQPTPPVVYPPPHAHHHTDNGHEHDDMHEIEMPAKRSSMIMYDGAAGGDEELEHVMPSLDRMSKLRTILNHILWNLVIFLAISAEIVLIIFKVALAKDSYALELTAIILMGFFLAEICLRILAFGMEFFKNIRFVIYSGTTIAALLFIVNAFSIEIQTRDIVAIVLQCASAGLRFVSFFCELGASARSLVSTNKARYQKHGFNLDLCYVGADRVIAMGLPSTRIEAVYRNPIDEVARFFNTMHKDHYLIINLCSERTYPTEKFHGRVVRFPFDDHGPAPLSTYLQLCVYVDEFLKQDKENVVAIHCKGGKGRTGSMVAAWLLYSKPDMYADQALKLFATYRTAQEIGGRLQGVSGPSQKRYIGYFENLRFVTRDKTNVLAESFSHLRNTPPCELVSLTLNHVAPIEVGKEMRATGGAVNEKARDVHNSQWNKSRNWSLLITYYPPISTFSNSSIPGSSSSSSTPALVLPKESHFVEVEDDDDNWSADNINRRNLARYSDTKEFYFPAREKELTSSDDSITFDISSFHEHAKSLILTGDLKFQVFRGHLAASLDTQKEKEKEASIGNEEKPFVYCWFWVNTSFMNPNSTQFLLRKEQIDEVARDSKVDPEMNLALTYHCPPRAESWAHAPHPEFHLIPEKSPKSPKTLASPTIDED